MWILIAVIALILVMGMFIFNKFIRYKNLMREAWSGIDVQLKRRHDLIPGIVDAVKGYMRHEKKLFEDITDIRTKITLAVTVKQHGETEKTLSQALKNIFAVAEAYPDLKANQNFLQLQKTLTEIEDQIQLARRYYNGTVRNYNILVESIPSNIVAGMFGFKQAEFFEIEYATERQTPDVRF